MKTYEKVIYVIGTLSVILFGIIVVGGIALFMTNRIDTATENHTERELERLEQMTEEEQFIDAEIIIEDIYTYGRHGSVKWTTTETALGEYEEGEIFYEINRNNEIRLSRYEGKFPKYVEYRDEVLEAIENEINR